MYELVIFNFKGQEVLTVTGSYDELMTVMCSGTRTDELIACGGVAWELRVDQSKISRQ